MKVKIGATTILCAFLIAAGMQKTARADDQYPYPSGTFSFTNTGLLAVCLNPTTSALEACTTPGVLAEPLSVVEVGSVNYDHQGHGCLSETASEQAFPPGASTMPLNPNQHEVWTITKFDPTNGTGDEKFTVWTGGQCNGPTFDNTGATQTASGTLHFVLSEDGRRLDSQYTSITNSTDSLGAFSLYAVCRKE